MIVSPAAVVNVPLIAPSVNVQTEQVARDNKVREPIAPAVALAKANAERKVKSDDKRRQQSAWDPSEHPGYETDNETDAVNIDDLQDPFDRLFSLLALKTYSADQGKGYTMRFRLPKHVLDAAIREGQMEQRRKVIKYHYGHSVAPHAPSEVLVVL